MKIRHNIYFVLLLAVMVLGLPNVVNAIEDTVEDTTVEESIVSNDSEKFDDNEITDEETIDEEIVEDTTEEDETVYVAKIGDVSYETLEEAIAAAEDGATIELLADVKLTKTFYKSLTFTGGYTVSMDVYGWRYNGNLVFDNANLSINSDANSPVANNGEAGRWFTMVLNGSITAKNGANITFTFDSLSGTNCAIYTGGKGVSINVENNSKFHIIGKNTKGISGQGIQLDSTANTGIYVKGNSEFLIEGTNRGYVNSPEIYVENSTFTVQNCTSNASNGGKFTAINSDITFYNNGGHGLSATNLVVQNSNVVTNKNAYYGITIGSKITVDATSTITSNENGYGFTGGALRIYGAKSTGYFEAGSKVILNNNLRNALENYGTTIFEDGVELTIVGNLEPSNGAGVFNGATGNLTLPANATIMNNTATVTGGGVRNKGTIIIPGSVKLYNNHAGSAGDDIYSDGTINFGAVGDDWVLDGEPDCTDKINGWYDDNEEKRWEAHAEDEANNYYDEVYSGTFNNQLSIKAAHDKAKVIVHYINTRGEKLTDDVTIIGSNKLEYVSEEKTFAGYELIEVPYNSTGIMTRDNDIHVYYVYTDEIGDEGEMVPPHTGVSEVAVNTSNVTLYFENKKSFKKVNF